VSEELERGFGMGCVLNRVLLWNLPDGTDENYKGT
jgi:hypothetical protein